MTYRLELFSNDPFWKSEWIVSVQNENFAVEVAGGVLNVTRASL